MLICVVPFKLLASRVQKIGWWIKASHKNSDSSIADSILLFVLSTPQLIPVVIKWIYEKFLTKHAQDINKKDLLVNKIDVNTNKLVTNPHH